MALIIIFQAIDVVTVHSISPIMYKHKSVDGCITPFNHMQLMSRSIVHLWTTDTAAQTENEGMTQKKSTIVSNGQSNSSSIQPCGIAVSGSRSWIIP